MGVLTKHLEITSTVAPEKMFKAFCLDSDEIFPKVLPQVFKSIELVEGDGCAGSFKKITFAEAEKFKYAKHRVDFLDKEKFEYHYTWVEGDALMHVFEKVSYEIKFEEHHHLHHGGSKCKITTKFFVVGDVHIDDAQLEEGKEKVVLLFRAVEGYVLANP